MQMSRRAKGESSKARSGLTTACSRRCYRAAPAKALVILACLAREGVFDTRNAAEANRYGTEHLGEESNVYDNDSYLVGRHRIRSTHYFALSRCNLLGPKLFAVMAARGARKSVLVRYSRSIS